MSLELLSDNLDELGKRKRQVKRNNARKVQKKANRIKKRMERKSGKKPKLVAKIGLAPARNSFLTLVALNFGGLAKKLANSIKKDSNKVRKFWTKYGGDYNKLKNTVAKGSKQALNAAPAAAGALAVATPIIIGVNSVFKELKESPIAQTLVNTMKKRLLDNKDIPKSVVNMPEGSEVAKEITTDNAPPMDDGKDNKDKKNNNLLIIGGLVAGAYLLTRKK